MDKRLAFPIPNSREFMASETGMSLYEYYVGQALCGLATSINSNDSTQSDLINAVGDALRMAEITMAMLEERAAFIRDGVSHDGDHDNGDRRSDGDVVSNPEAGPDPKDPAV